MARVTLVSRFSTPGVRPGGPEFLQQVAPRPVVAGGLWYRSVRGLGHLDVRTCVRHPRLGELRVARVWQHLIDAPAEHHVAGEADGDLAVRRRAAARSHSSTVGPAPFQRLCAVRTPVTHWAAPGTNGLPDGAGAGGDWKRAPVLVPASISDPVKGGAHLVFTASRLLDLGFAGADAGPPAPGDLVPG